MRRIPPKLREQMANDPYMKKCCMSGSTAGKIDWHHNLIYGGRQVNEWWAILPLKHDIHAVADRKDIKSRLDWIMLNRASESELKAYPKAELLAKRDRLNKIYGKYNKSWKLLQETNERIL